MHLPETVDLDEVDESSSAANPVCYFIVGGNSLGVFSLDPRQHTLKVFLFHFISFFLKNNLSNDMGFNFE